MEGAPSQACVACGAGLPPDAVFCSQCGTRQPARCAGCGAGLDTEARFCSHCGTAVVVEVSVPSTRTHSEERKVVTALFCDLVGFTALSESADPEDVDRMLTSYFEVARSAIEAYGGVVEKFIGDAVVGVFGVPAAHEDDPERAIRAGLRIAEEAEHLTALDGGSLRLRVGINTGETLVRLDVAPGSGERFLAGDAINTASRIQSVAPLMGVAVGRSTYDATRLVFVYADLPPAVLKGKTEPVAVFHAVAPRARLGTDVTRVHDGPFVGREIDLALVKSVFDKTLASSSVQLVTIVGEPGMGKSRLVAELSRYADSRPELVTWRQGRCLPYGDGITYWALSEVVKAHAGILDSDSPDTATEKLDVVLPDDQRDWYRQRLLPLIGVATTSTPERDELFAACTGFLEHVADSAPTVVVLEDLHWADEPMLAFVQHLAAHAQAVPLLVVGTARPDLFQQHESYGTGVRNATTVTLSPLTPDETSRLVAALLGTTAAPAALQAEVTQRAAGNPLYAEELLRLLQDRGLLVETGASWSLTSDDALPLPATIEALISARIDGLTSEAKAVIGDAAVIGKVFWDGALVSMSGLDRSRVATVLHELTVKQLVRPARHSSVADVAEYSFWHALTRDVAYSHLPRSIRAEKHVAAATWIEWTSSGRPDDVADVLAYHHLRALELARATGDDVLAAQEEGLAQQYLVSAGRRALRLDPAAALTHFQNALALASDDERDPRRPEVLRLLGEAAHWGAGREPEAEAAYTEAVELYRAQGDDAGLGRALYELGWVLQGRGDGRWEDLHEESVTVLERLPPGRDLLLALSTRMYKELNYGRLDETLAAGKVLEQVAAEAGLPVPAWAFGYRGMARSSLGDAGGLDDLRTCVELVQLEGDPGIPGALRNLASTTQLFEGYGNALSACIEWAAFARGRGLSHAGREIDSERVWFLIESGELDAADSLADALESHFIAGGVALNANYLRSAKIRVAVLRGRASEALDRLPELMRTARSLRSPEDLVVGLGPSAEVHAALGLHEQAVHDLEEIAATPGVVTALAALPWLPSWLRSATRLGDLELAERILDATDPKSPLDLFNAQAARAVLTEATLGPEAALDAYSAVVDGARRFGAAVEEGFAQLGRARCLHAIGRQQDAAPALQRAEEIFAPAGMAPALAEVRALLAR